MHGETVKVTVFS